MGHTGDNVMSKSAEKISEKGSTHWWLQRISALALIPLSVWFVFAILVRIDDSQFAIADWLAETWVSVALIVYLVVGFFHSQLGLQVVIEDYISTPNTRHKTLLVAKVINILCALLAIFSVLRISDWLN